GLGRLGASLGLVFGLPHQGLLLLLLLHQGPGRLRAAALAARQRRGAGQQRQPPSKLHHIPPAMRDRPRMTDRTPMPPVTISKAGSRVMIMTPVIFTVSRPIFSRSSKRRRSRTRCAKRFSGSCTAPP